MAGILLCYVTNVLSQGIGIGEGERGRRGAGEGEGQKKVLSKARTQKNA